MSVMCQSRPTVEVRPLMRGDVATVLEVFAGLGSHSRRQRFLTPKPRLTGADLRALTAVDERVHIALVAVSPDGRPVGIARFIRERADPRSADVAVAVVDAWQGRGIGSTLADALVRRAQEVGVCRFTVMMSPDNEAAVRLLHRVPGEIERSTLDEHAAEFEVRLCGSVGLRAG